MFGSIAFLSAPINLDKFGSTLCECAVFLEFKTLT